jgi:peptide/nickel transport system substrate-binding protein
MLLVLGAPFLSSHASGPPPEYGKWGPRVDHLQLIIYNSYEAEAAAFQAGSIDVMDWPLDYSTYQTIKNDSNFVKEPLTMYDVYDIDINNLRWPTSDYRFRRAIAYLIDYEKFYTDVLRAYSGELMDNIIWWEWTKWYNSGTMKYWYDNATALSMLADAGYQDWHSTGKLEWKAPNGTIYPLPNLEFYARDDDPIRHALGDMINAELNAAGIPTNYHVASEEVCWAHAYKMPYDFNLFTAGMGPFRDVQWLYDYYHSQFATPDIDWAMNNVFFANATYDSWVEKLKFAPDEATAIDACKHAQEIFMDQMPLIPVYHSAGSEAYAAKYGHHSGEDAYWDKPWNGFVNSIIPTVNSGIDDWWTLLDAHPGDVQAGGVLRFGMINDVDHVNPVTVYSTWDVILLDELYSTLIMRDPYNGDVLPWLAKGWKFETWDYGGQNATKLTIKLYDNLKWSDGTPLNSTDVAFSMKYMYDASSASYYSYVEKIDGIDTATPHIETPDPQTVVIYYTIESIWSLEWAGTTPIMPKSVWETIPANDTDAQGEFVKTGNLTCSGPYLIDSYKKGEWWLLRRNPYFFRILPDAKWTFSVTGLQDYDGTDDVLTVDGVGYKATSLQSPLAVSFVNGTSHTYAFTNNVSTSAKQYTWQNCSGDNTQISSSIVGNTNGSITANYASQVIPEYTAFMFLAVMLSATVAIAVTKKKLKMTLRSKNPKTLTAGVHA